MNTIHYDSVEFASIIPKPNEDLNIERNVVRILRYCWYNTDKFPTVPHISEITGLPERMLYRYAHSNSWPRRKDIKKENKANKNVKQYFGRKRALKTPKR